MYSTSYVFVLSVCISSVSRDASCYIVMFANQETRQKGTGNG